MCVLDGQDLTSALESLAGAMHAAPAELAQALRGYDDRHFETADEGPWQLMPREVLAPFDACVAVVAERFALDDRKDPMRRE